MEPLFKYIEMLEKKPLASAVESLIQSKRVLDDLDDPDRFSAETIQKDISQIGPELYAFIFRQAGISQAETIDESLSNAIVKLGFSQVKRLIYFHIAYSTEVANMQTPEDKSFAARVWSLNYTTAMIATYWCGFLRPDQVDDIYYLGMLQKIGISAFAQLEPAKHRALREGKRAVPLTEKERDHFGCTHYELGMAIVDHWNLPKMHKSAMRFEETHGQSTAYVSREIEEDLFLCLYYAKFKADRRMRGKGADRSAMGIDPFFDYNSTILQIFADKVNARRAAS